MTDIPPSTNEGQWVDTPVEPMITNDVEIPEPLQEVTAVDAVQEAVAMPAASPPPSDPIDPIPPPPSGPVTDKSSEQFSATPPPSPELSPALRQGPTPVSPSIADRLSQALEALKFNKRKKLDKILVLAAKKGRIKNDDVEKLLHVSDSTAARYLRQLVLEARLFITKKGNDAWYEPR